MTSGEERKLGLAEDGLKDVEERGCKLSLSKTTTPTKPPRFFLPDMNPAVVQTHKRQPSKKEGEVY